jgi:hypothetical protein
MNIQKIKATTLLAAAGIALFTSAVKADALTYNDGDLLIGFYATGGTGATKDIVVNIGAAATFRDATGDFSINLGNLGADLTATFGSNWSTRADLFWGVVGAVQDTPVNGDGIWTLYAGKAEATIGVQGIGYNRGSVSTQSAPASKIAQVGNTYETNYTSTANSSVTAIQNTSDANSYAFYQSNGGFTSFAYFNNAAGTFASGTSGTALDLFRMPTGSSSGPKGTYEGTFHIDNTGSVSYTTAPTPVPEPGTVFIGIALVGFIAWRERSRLASLLKLTQQS